MSTPVDTRHGDQDTPGTYRPRHGFTIHSRITPTGNVVPWYRVAWFATRADASYFLGAYVR